MHEILYHCFLKKKILLKIINKTNILHKILFKNILITIFSDHGKVFAWGFGILGLGPEAQQSYTPLKIPTTLFGVNQFNPYTKVVKVAAGLSHSAIITSNGDVYSWGVNKSACLGLGDRKDRFFPLRVAVGAHVTKIALGVDHTVALCKPFI